MANFVYGFYTIKSSKENIDKIIDNNQDIKPMTASNILSTILPYPSAYTNPNINENQLLNDYGFAERNEWQERHWGCKWDIDLSDDIIREDDNTIILHGRTPYSPPDILIENVADEYDITLLAHQEDMTALYHIRSDKYVNVIQGKPNEFPEFIKEEFKKTFGNDFFDDLIDTDIDLTKLVFTNE